MKFLYVLTFGLLLLSCKTETKSQEIKSFTVQEIIDKSIEVAGGSQFESSKISFNFRDKFYEAKHNEGEFSLLRISIKNETDSIIDILSNDGFERITNNKVVEVPDSMVVKYSASVNSVHYFSVLPHGLNDKAVNKKLIGEEQIKNEAYYKIEVTFDEVGGGEDFEDVFIYWINKTSFKPDYLAYLYNEDDGKGMRFREAYNERYIEGLRFVDYNNFKPENNSTKLRDLGKAFENNQLQLLSKIDLENIEVTLINPQQR